MESNGKRVTVDGDVLPFDAGEVDFGEPGTNGQHSFYQLLHQGRVVPADFIGFVECQEPIELSCVPSRSTIYRSAAHRPLQHPPPLAVAVARVVRRGRSRVQPR